MVDFIGLIQEFRDNLAILTREVRETREIVRGIDTRLKNKGV